ncbi:chromosome partitioning ATPase [Massilia eurypsychrophila]|uniref:non-specific protein-tyrosine kinase n=1 Tax=Massilia eurypsychrophila TaxID=1485217 RepID=A0A2G8TLS5_9BURK|nr:XrtA-associated tyrosine autokinase [Massilia eurypsychrophila]PIL46993.1 chromosome partitioning ATPase [Massilia eurypsychrophila]
MSIIEKAASRIDHKREAAPASPVEISVPIAAPVAHTPIIVAAAAAAASHAAPAPVVARAVPAAVPVPAPVEMPVIAPAPAAEPAAAPRKQSTRKVELDLNRMREMGMVTAAGGRTLLVEDFRIIKRPLIKRAFAEHTPGTPPGNLIMITSSLPGEGKTYCAINLAMSIAMELDHTVLLIDADVARPSVLRTLGLPAQRGLMDILLDDKLELADVMLRTNVDTLSILPAGTSTPRATELLASQTMSTFVYEIANRYPDRIVIFDSPPLLLTSEAHVLATHMGQIVLVVESETTTQHAVKESLRQLEGCTNVNLIYNKTREFPGIEETYDYHYG